MGGSRDTFYRYQQAVEEGGFDALVEKTRRKASLRNRIASEIEEEVLAPAIEEGLIRLRTRRGRSVDVKPP